jgi:hypothetical protein
MPKKTLVPIWDPQACVPKRDIIEGKYLQAELALDLYTIAEGTAKPPYHNAESFFQATHPTATLKQILLDVLQHLAGTKTINPVLLFDAGFGGGKSHTMAAVYYAVKEPTNPEIQKMLKIEQTPQNCRVVVIDGSAYGGRGVKRGENLYRTIWADFLHQLGETQLAKNSDTPEGLPDRQTITELLKKQPTLVLIDELPKYLDLVKDQPELLTRVKHFIHTLSLSVCEAEGCVLIISVAGDVYIDAADAVRRELTGAMEILNRKMQSIEPVKAEDIPHILKRRLFDSINSKIAESTAKAYVQMYEEIKAPNHYRTVEYQNRIAETYPFHPELIDVLYQRLSTLPEFQRTRGALRLLAHVINKIWKEKEKDAFLIHPYHVDLSSPEIVQELTTRLKEEKYINAIASDVYSGSGRKAKAQQKDEEYKSHFKAPLFRRACNTIYLYSLTGAKEESKGIDIETLITVLAVPGEEHVPYYRDQVLPLMAETFWYIEQVGNRFVFKREPTENRIIDQESQNVPTSKIISTIRTTLQELYSTKGHFFLEIFPEEPGKIDDNTDLKVAILNPIMGHTIAREGEVSEKEKIAQFILYRDSRGNLRTYRNNLFLLVAKEGAWENLRDAAARLEVVKALVNDPEKYGIPHEKKKSIQQKLGQYEMALNDTIRSSFTYLVYATKRGKIEAKYFRPSGYGTAQPGQEVLWQILSKSLHRVTEEPLDPDYVKEEAWPVQVPETTTQALFENLHRKTGVVLPENQELFEQTLIEGVKRGLWVLIQQDKVYAPENPPTRVIISSDSRLLLPEEAGQQGLTDPHGHLCPKCQAWPCQCSQKPKEKLIVETHFDISPEKETFEPLPPRMLIEDLEKWARREGIETATEVTIRILGATDVATQFINLLRLLRAGKKFSTEVKVKTKASSPDLKLEITLETDEKGIEKPAVKILNNIAGWGLPGFEGSIKIGGDDIQIDEIKRQLKNTLGSGDSNIKVGLEIKPKKGENAV